MLDLNDPNGVGFLEREGVNVVEILGFSVAPSLAVEYERLAARQRTTKSELFRRMVEAYKAKLGVETRLEAALWARDRGLVRGEPKDS